MPIGSPDVDLAGGDAGVATTVSSPDASSAPASPITLSDDSMIQPPGATAPVAFKDWIGTYVSKTEHDKLNAELGRRASAEDLIARAQQIDQQRKATAQPQAAQQGAPRDPFSSIRGRNFTSGDQVTQIAEQFQKAITGDRQALTQYATAVNKILSDNAELTKKLDNRIGTFESTRTNDQQNSQITALTDAALGKVGMDLSNDAFGPVRDVMRKLATDHYFAYEPGEGQTRAQYDAEYPARAAEDFEEKRVAFRQYERIAADQARLARFPGRGGNATPTGAAKSRWISPQERAANFHIGRESANT